MRRFLYLVASCSVLACTPPLPAAPDALDTNVAWFWVNSEAASETELLDAAAKLSVAGKAETRAPSMPFKGQQRGRLAQADLKVVGLERNDPSKARGLLVANVFPCTLEKLSSILSDADQRSLYPDVWDRNERTLTSDRQAFLEGARPTLAWTSEIGVTFPVADPYSSTVRGSLRRITPSKDSVVPSDIIVARTWLTAPATFGATSSSSFTQNYEIEIFWEQTPGQIFHAYGMWREVKIGGFNKTIEDDDFFSLVLNNLVDWDNQKTAKLCAR